MRAGLSVKETVPELCISMGSGQSDHCINFALYFKNMNQISLNEVREASLRAVKHSFQVFPKPGHVQNSHEIKVHSCPSTLTRYVLYSDEGVQFVPKYLCISETRHKF